MIYIKKKVDRKAIKQKHSESRYMPGISIPPLSFSPTKATNKTNMFPSLEHHYLSPSVFSHQQAFCHTNSSFFQPSI